MSDAKDKLLIKKLANIVMNQQKIISKLAQNYQELPTAHDAQNVTKREADVIVGSLPPVAKSAVERIEVHNNEVRVRFHPGKDSDAAFNAVEKTVQNLQASNMLPGTNYVIKQV
jgi:hypothetical protein